MFRTNLVVVNLSVKMRDNRSFQVVLSKGHNKMPVEVLQDGSHQARKDQTTKEQTLLKQRNSFIPLVTRTFSQIKMNTSNKCQIQQESIKFNLN